MNVDFMDLLKQNVSAIVLEGDTQHLLEKNQAIQSFLPILLSILKSKSELIPAFQQQLNPRLNDAFASNVSLKQQFLEHVRGAASADEIESTLSRSITPALAFLTTEAGSSEPEAISHLLQVNTDSISRALPEWATALLAGLGVNILQGQATHVAPASVHATKVDEKRSFLLPVLALIIFAALFAFIFRACTDKATTETAPAANMNASQPAKFQITTGATGDLITCQIFSANAAYVEILQKEVKQIFNNSIGCGADMQSMYHTEFIDQDAIPSVISALKGVPNINLTWFGNQLSIQSQDPANALKVADQIKPLLRNMTVVTQQPLDVNRAVDTSISDAERALAEINPEQVRALDVATALNLQIINFDTASSTIPDANKSILDQAAALMQKAPQVKLTVMGHTDATGDAAVNKTLSQNRAQAVVDYLIFKGVDPAQLRAIGYGQEKPIADNQTDEGKFKNRRIEFEVLNTDSGVVREVDDRGVEKVN